MFFFCCKLIFNRIGPVCLFVYEKYFGTNFNRNNTSNNESRCYFWMFNKSKGFISFIQNQHFYCLFKKRRRKNRISLKWIQYSLVHQRQVSSIRKQQVERKKKKRSAVDNNTIRNDFFLTFTITVWSAFFFDFINKNRKWEAGIIKFISTTNILIWFI